MLNILKLVGPRGLYLNMRTYLFLATKAATWLWFGMVIGIDHPHTHSGKYTQYVEAYGPQGPIFKYEGSAFFSNQGSHLALVWYGDRY